MSVSQPETRYARSGEVSLDYQVTGAGSVDLVYVPGAGQHVELNWENPPVSRFLERLGSLGRLIVFDKRGTGMSDRVVGSPTVEARMDDVRAAMDAFYEEMRRRWGEPGFAEEIVRRGNPDASEEEVRGYARVFRLSVSPGAVAQFNAMSLDVDVSDVLPTVRVPTLFFHRPDAPGGDIRVAEYIASRIPNARIVDNE